MELDHKLIESTEDGDLVLALNADGWFRKRQQQKTSNRRGRYFKTYQTTKM